MLRAGVLVLLLAVSWMVAAEPRSVWDGVYTKAQAVRGDKLYREACARCHGENLAGGDEAQSWPAPISARYGRARPLSA